MLLTLVRWIAAFLQNPLETGQGARGTVEPPGRTSGVRTGLPLAHSGCIFTQTIVLQTILYKM
jgi:hypothetical protein